jgi:hypothetical protein
MRCDDADRPATYRILDHQGRLIGRVRAPQGQPSLGRGAGTVLLVRERSPGPAGGRERGRPLGCQG